MKNDFSSRPDPPLFEKGNRSGTGAAAGNEQQLTMRSIDSKEAGGKRTEYDDVPLKITVFKFTEE